MAGTGHALMKMLPPAFPASVSNIDHRGSKKSPVRNGVSRRGRQSWWSHCDAGGAKWTVPPVPPDDSSVPDIGYKASVDKNPPGANRRVFDCVDNQTVERPDVQRCPNDTRRAQPHRWPNGMAESQSKRMTGNRKAAAGLRSAAALPRYTGDQP